MIFGAINDVAVETERQVEKQSKKLTYKFGLNRGVITKIEYNPTATKDGSPADAFDMHLSIEDKEFRFRAYDVTRVYDKNNNELTPDSSEYQELYDEQMMERMATITHIVKATGTSQRTIDEALATPVSSFVEWIIVMVSLVKTQNSPVDVFLEYPWNPNTDNKKYLILPKNMKGGYWICPKTTDEWEEVKDDTGLFYVSKTNKGKKHIFQRDDNYMKSNKALVENLPETTQSPKMTAITAKW